MTPSVAILTISDRAYTGVYDDKSGPAVAAIIRDQEWKILRQAVIPDDRRVIEAVLSHWARIDRYDLILTNGGTGLGPRDVTPEATRSIIDREIPGIGELMRRQGERHNALAALSRGIAGMSHDSLIINLPGNPKAAQENLQAILGLIEHSLDMIHGGGHNDSHQLSAGLNMGKDRLAKSHGETSGGFHG